MSAKRFNKMVLLTLLMSLAFISIFNIYVDPFFHYHTPLEAKIYPLNSERYQNDGIMRHFQYEAIITGTSMCDNFKVSECEKLFGYSTIKVPFSAGSYYEVARNLKKGLSTNPDVKLVIRSLDLWGGEYILSDKDSLESAFTYPDYLYDDNIFNDVNYFLNKDVLSRSLAIFFNTNTEPVTDFDMYANWMKGVQFGSKQVLSMFERLDTYYPPLYLTNEQKEQIRDTIRQNYTDIAYNYPETTFYIFIPPYSICYWDNIVRNGEFYSLLEAEKIAIEELLACPNIKVYSFSNNFDWTCNLDNYKDRLHYGEWINSDILLRISQGENLITQENYVTYLNEIFNFYSNFNYDVIYEESTN